MHVINAACTKQAINNIYVLDLLLKRLSMANDLKPYEKITRVFWIKIELKENQRAGRQTLGEIKDVMSGEKRAIRELGDIMYFMIPYLEKMGIKVQWYWRFRSWSNQKRRRNNPGLSNPSSKDEEHRANS